MMTPSEGAEAILTPGLLALGALRLETLSAGPSPDAAPTLVLLHEGLGSAMQWRSLMASLIEATGCGAFAYSRQGYGASTRVELPRPLDYLEREAADVLPRVLDAAGIGSCVLVGHSDGASIAALAAAGGDERIRGAALISPHVFVEDVTLKGVASAEAAFRGGRLRRKLAARHDDVDGAFFGWSHAWLDPRRLDWSIVEALRRIVAPLAIIQGDADPYGSARQAEVAAAASGGPVAVSVLPGVGHEPHREAPQATLAAIVQLVRGALTEGAATGRRHGA
jgi:pimeloyl-ACP methyl ester carboxylesterase